MMKLLIAAVSLWMPITANAATVFTIGFEASEASTSGPNIVAYSLDVPSGGLIYDDLRFDGPSYGVTRRVSDSSGTVLRTDAEGYALTISPGSKGGGAFDLNYLEAKVNSPSMSPLILAVYYAGNDAWRVQHASPIGYDYLVKLPVNGNMTGYNLDIKSVGAVAIYNSFMGNFAIDNVRGTSNVPEPSSWMMTILGFFIFVFKLRHDRRRRFALST